MEKLFDLLKKRGVDGWEIFYTEKEQYDLIIEASETKSVESHISRITGLRVFYEGRVGFSSTTGDDYEDVVEAAIETSRYGREAIFEFPGKTEYRDPERYYPGRWPLGDRILEARHVNERLKELYPGLQIQGKLGYEDRFVRIVNSSGFEGEYRKTVYTTEMLFMGSVETGNLFAFSARARADGPVPPVEVFEDLLKQLDGVERRAVIKSGRYKVLFAPVSLLETFVEALMGGIYGPNVESKATPLYDKLGKRVFDPGLTVIDKANLPGGERPFDDEGVVTQDRFIVKDGVLKSFLTDLYYARKLGVEPSGSTRRGGGITPQISINNLEIFPGDRSLDEIIRKLDEGIIVYMPMGAAASNFKQGNISFNVTLGYHIKDGEITGRVVDTVISGNIYENFKNVLSISKEREDLYFNSMAFRVPYILVDSMEVVTKDGS